MTLTKTIAMTTIQKTIIATVAAAAIVTARWSVPGSRRFPICASRCKRSKQQQEQQAVLSNQVQELQRERDRATNALAALAAENAGAEEEPERGAETSR